jgi:hypothetical protein
MLRKREGVVVVFRDGRKDEFGRGHNFWTDTVTREKYDSGFHEQLETISGAELRVA